MTIWYYSRDGQQLGPHSEQELVRFVAEGRLRRGDLVWKEGTPEWVVAGTVPALFPEVAPPPVPRPTMPAAPAPAYYREEPASEPPELWNPNAAALWCLLLSPAFGAWLHAKNWEALGQPDKAKASMVWVWGVLAVIFIVAVMQLETGVSAIGLAILATWYFMLGKQQVDLVQREYPVYRRRGWLAPILKAFAVFIGLVIVAAIVMLILGTGASSSGGSGGGKTL